jgi:hypothetical protein
MEPERVLIYLYKGITFALNNVGHKHYPFIALTKIIQSMVFTKYPHEGIAFLFRFELLIFGGKERVCGLSAKLELL